MDKVSRFSGRHHCRDACSSLQRNALVGGRAEEISALLKNKARMEKCAFQNSVTKGPMVSGLFLE